MMKLMFKYILFVEIGEIRDMELIVIMVLNLVAYDN